MQHLLNKHMVDNGGWEPTDDRKDIERRTKIGRRTKRRCIRKPRSTSTRSLKNQQKMMQNPDPVVLNQPKPVVVQDSATNKTKTTLLVARPPRRSKRLREKVSGYVLDEVSRQNEASLCVPKKKKKKVMPTIAQLIAAEEDEIKSHYHNEVQDKPKFKVFEIANDGNSLFRAFAHQLYGLEDEHPFIRNICCRYVEMYRERFQLINAVERNYVDFSHYLDRMRTLRTSGGNLEITALSEFYERPVEIYARHNVPWTTISHTADQEKGLPPIRITVDNGNHYCSVVSEDHEKTVLITLGVFEEPVMFQHALKVNLGYRICKVKDDGNCIFSAFSHQIYGDACFHALIRDKCCDYMDLYRERFQDFIDTEKHYANFSHYLNNMRALRTWGGNLEITALSELYQRPVEVYAQQTTPRTTFSDSVTYDNDLPPIRVSFKNGNHYDSIVSEDHGNTILNVAEAGEFEETVLASLSY